MRTNTLAAFFLILLVGSDFQAYAGGIGKFSLLTTALRFQPRPFDSCLYKVIMPSSIFGEYNLIHVAASSIFRAKY